MQSISLARLVAALLFASLVFQNVPLAVVVSLYMLAAVTDLIDGYVARRLKLETHFGRVLDLVSDKSLTIVSLLYAAVRGIDIVPLAIIATREIISMGARLIVVQGRQLLPTSRVLGGTMAVVLWGNTLLLVIVGQQSGVAPLANSIYWICAIVVTLNLGWRIYLNADRINASLLEDERRGANSRKS